MVSLFTAAVLFICGALIKYGKFYNLIAGYNTMSTEEKENIDIVGYANLMGSCFTIMSIVILINAQLAKRLDYAWLEVTGIIVTVFVGVIYLLVKGKEFKKS